MKMNIVEFLAMDATLGHRERTKDAGRILGGLLSQIGRDDALVNLPIGMVVGMLMRMLMRM